MRFIAVGAIVLALFLGQQLPGPPQKPAQAYKFTVKEMCRGPNRPGWCTEFYADLAHGKEERAKLRKQGKKIEECETFDELQQSHMEGLE